MRGGAVSNMSSTCIQGGHPRPLGGYQPNLIVEPHSPAPAWHQSQQPVIPKQETIDERNDSGLASDFHSSSPGSENSQDYSAQTVNLHQNPSYYNSQLLSRVPGSPPMGYHKIHLPYQNHQQPTPTKSNEETEDPLRRLQYALETSTLIPHQQPPSPKNSEHSLDDDKSDIEGEIDEQGLRIPRINSHGKVKKFRCKQCDFVAITKLDFWEHSKAHIKAEKRLTCPKCPFVTEYKHHLEYHLRNHFGSKPFKCDQCSYSCVNKSMLNSHMKSHSNVYQYRCADCSYATKYCHSLKLHLRKYRHKPAMVLNPDGSPNPLPIIDVYGTRRGPKQKTMRKAEEGATSDLPNPFTHFLLNTQASPMQLPFPYHLLAGIHNPLTNPMLFPQSVPPDEEKREEVSQPALETSEVLDLSKPSSPAEPPSKSRRKGPAFKLNHLQVTESSEDENGETDEEKEPPTKSEDNNNIIVPASFSCQYCSISFGDIVLYTMHMGYHGFRDPFTCNMCGEQCNDKVSFFLHIARYPHT